jgi:crossover junction endodeoxyribonuclease RuvC
MKVIAIDPGYDRCGIAVLEKKINNKEVIIFSECFQTDKKKSLQQRIFSIGKRIELLIKTYHPESMAIEGLFFSKNTKTALQVSEARGVIIFQAMNNKLTLYEYTPNQIKVAVTGYGSAKKQDVHRLVEKLIILEDKKYIDDEVDAIATGLTFFASYKLHNGISIDAQ